jgi:hypothetical protein
LVLERGVFEVGVRLLLDEVEEGAESALQCEPAERAESTL